MVFQMVDLLEMLMAEMTVQLKDPHLEMRMGSLLETQTECLMGCLWAFQLEILKAILMGALMDFDLAYS